MSFSKEDRKQVYDFFERTLMSLNGGPVDYNHLRGYISKAPIVVHKFIKKECKGDNLLDYFKKRKNYFIVDRNDVSLKKKRLKKISISSYKSEDNDELDQDTGKGHEDINCLKYYEKNVGRDQHDVTSKKKRLKQMSFSSYTSEDMEKEDYDLENMAYGYEEGTESFARSRSVSCTSTNTANSFNEKHPINSYDNEEIHKYEELTKITIKHFSKYLARNEKVKLDAIEFDDLPKKVRRYLSEYMNKSIVTFFQSQPDFHVDDNYVMLSSSISAKKEFDHDQREIEKNKNSNEVKTMERFLKCASFFFQILKNKDDPVPVGKLSGYLSAVPSIFDYLKRNYSHYSLFFKDAPNLFILNDQDEVSVTCECKKILEEAGKYLQLKLENKLDDVSVKNIMYSLFEATSLNDTCMLKSEKVNQNTTKGLKNVNVPSTCNKNAKLKTVDVSSTLPLNINVNSQNYKETCNKIVSNSVFDKNHMMGELERGIVVDTKFDKTYECLIECFYIVHMLSYEIVEEEKVLCIKYENQAIKFFGKILSKTTVNLKDLSGYIGQAPEEIKFYMKRLYKGEKFQEFFKQKQEFVLTYYDSQLEFLYLSPMFQDIMERKSRDVKTINKTKEFVKDLQNNNWMKITLNVFKDLFEISLFLQKRGKTKISNLSGFISNLSAEFQHVLKKYDGKSSSENLKVFLEYFRIYCVLDDTYVTISSEVNAPLLVEMLKQLSSGFSQESFKMLAAAEKEYLDYLSENFSYNPSLDCDSLKKEVIKCVKTFLNDKDATFINYTDLFKILGPALVYSLFHLELWSPDLIWILNESNLFDIDDGKIQLKIEVDERYNLSEINHIISHSGQEKAVSINNKEKTCNINETIENSLENSSIVENRHDKSDETELNSVNNIQINNDNSSEHDCDKFDSTNYETSSHASEILSPSENTILDTFLNTQNSANGEIEEYEERSNNFVYVPGMVITDKLELTPCEKLKNSCNSDEKILILRNQDKLCLTNIKKDYESENFQASVEFASQSSTNQNLSYNNEHDSTNENLFNISDTNKEEHTIVDDPLLQTENSFSLDLSGSAADEIDVLSTNKALDDVTINSNCNYTEISNSGYTKSNSDNGTTDNISLSKSIVIIKPSVEETTSKSIMKENRNPKDFSIDSNLFNQKIPNDLVRNSNTKNLYVSQNRKKSLENIAAILAESTLQNGFSKNDCDKLSNQKSTDTLGFILSENISQSAEKPSTNMTFNAVLETNIDAHDFPLNDCDMLTNQKSTDTLGFQTSENISLSAEKPLIMETNTDVHDFSLNDCDMPNQKSTDTLGFQTSENISPNAEKPSTNMTFNTVLETNADLQDFPLKGNCENSWNLESPNNCVKKRCSKNSFVNQNGKELIVNEITDNCPEEDSTLTNSNLDINICSYDSINASVTKGTNDCLANGKKLIKNKFKHISLNKNIPLVSINVNEPVKSIDYLSKHDINEHFEVEIIQSCDSLSKKDSLLSEAKEKSNVKLVKKGKLSPLDLNQTSILSTSEEFDIFRFVSNLDGSIPNRLDNIGTINVEKKECTSYSQTKYSIDEDEMKLLDMCGEITNLYENSRESNHFSMNHGNLSCCDIKLLDQTVKEICLSYPKLDQIKETELIPDSISEKSKFNSDSNIYSDNKNSMSNFTDFSSYACEKNYEADPIEEIVTNPTNNIASPQFLINHKSSNRSYYKENTVKDVSANSINMDNEESWLVNKTMETLKSVSHDKANSINTKTINLTSPCIKHEKSTTNIKDTITSSFPEVSSNSYGNCDTKSLFCSSSAVLDSKLENQELNSISKTLFDSQSLKSLFLQPLLGKIVLLALDSCIVESLCSKKRKTVFCLKTCFHCDSHTDCDTCFDSLKVGDEVSCYMQLSDIKPEPETMCFAFMFCKDSITGKNDCNASHASNKKLDERYKSKTSADEFVNDFNSLNEKYINIPQKSALIVAKDSQIHNLLISHGTQTAFDSCEKDCQTALSGEVKSLHLVTNKGSQVNYSTGNQETQTSVKFCVRGSQTEIIGKVKPFVPTVNEGCQIECPVFSQDTQTIFEFSDSVCQTEIKDLSEKECQANFTTLKSYSEFECQTDISGHIKAYFDSTNCTTSQTNLSGPVKMCADLVNNSCQSDSLSVFNHISQFSQTHSLQISQENLQSSTSWSSDQPWHSAEDLVQQSESFDLESVCEDGCVAEKSSSLTETASQTISTGPIMIKKYFL